MNEITSYEKYIQQTRWIYTVDTHNTAGLQTAVKVQQNVPAATIVVKSTVYCDACRYL